MFNFAFADTASTATSSSASIFSNFFIFIPIILLFWFLIIRPQSKRLKEHKKLISELKRGDKVLISPRMICKITKESDATFTVEIADGVEVQVEKSSVISRYEPTATTAVTSNKKQQK